MAALVSFKAGKCQRRGETNWVDPQSEKGLLYIEQNPEDGLTHFVWKNRDANQVVDDLIIFPGEATFDKVAQAPGGRVYVLKFLSSSSRQFFWMQDGVSALDEQRAARVNAVIEDPSAPLPSNWGQAPQTPTTTGPGGGEVPGAPRAQRATVPVTGAGAAARGAEGLTAEQMAQLRQILGGISVPEGAETTHMEELSLSDVLTPSSLLPLLSNQELATSLFPHLPPELPRDEASVRRVIESPQFQAAVRGLDHALRTGQLAPIAGSLGLEPEAGSGIEAFLRAIERQARGGVAGSSGEGEGEGEGDDRNDSMQTD